VIAATVAPAHAIRNGTADPGDPAVVALDGCTGTLIAPNVVLTAAHCVWQHDVTQIVAFFGADVAQPGESVPIVDGRVHPGFDLSSGDDDIAVLQLGSAVTDVKPVALSVMPFDDSFVGKSARMVGFGKIDPADFSSYGTRRQGSSTVQAFLGSSYTVGNTPSVACQGDSGGASFMMVGGTEVLTGVISRSDDQCSTFGVEMRVDAYLPGFILPFMQATQPGGTAAGDRCATELQCASGTCLAAPDEPRLRFCSPACGSDGDCPTWMRCARGTCAWPAPSPGAFGSACDQNADCLGWLCAAGEIGGARICTVECLPNGAAPCASGYHCVASPQDPGKSVCVASSQGGCALAGNQAPTGDPAWLVVVLAALGLALRASGARRGSRRPRC
jgi:hypothetical protein